MPCWTIDKSGSTDASATCWEDAAAVVGAGWEWISWNICDTDGNDAKSVTGAICDAAGTICDEVDISETWSNWDGSDNSGRNDSCKEVSWLYAISLNVVDSSIGGCSTSVNVTPGKTHSPTTTGVELTLCNAECLEATTSSVRCRRFPSEFNKVLVSDALVSAKKRHLNYVYK